MKTEAKENTRSKSETPPPLVEKKSRSFLSYMKQGGKPYKPVSQLSLVEKHSGENSLNKNDTARTAQWSESRFVL